MRAALGLVLLSALPAGAAAQPVAPPLALPVVVHVVSDEGRPVVSDDELGRWERAVSDLYAGAGVCVRVVERRPLAANATLARIAERRRLARFAVPRAVNLFVVARILDPRPSASTRRTAERLGLPLAGSLNGAHVPSPGRPPGTFLLVRAGAGHVTFAHELGHLLGAGHSLDPSNLMSYGRDRRAFDARQLRTFAARARRLVRTRALTPVASGCGGPAVSRP